MKKRPMAWLMAACAAAAAAIAPAQRDVARVWNEANLAAIRIDYARPTVHARNLYHVSCAMWDGWAAYDDISVQIMHQERATAPDIHAAREEAISYAAYGVLMHRFAESPGKDTTLPTLRDTMVGLGYDPDYTRTDEDTPASLGNRIAQDIIAAGLQDGSNEQNGYENRFYEPVNPPLLPDFPGNPDLLFPNRWQPLALKWFEDQSGNIIIGGYPDFLSPEWGQVTSFALTQKDLTIHNRDNFDYWVFHDPGPPPQLGGVGDDYYKWGFAMDAVWSSHLDPADGVMWDVSPGAIGNARLAGVNQWAQFYDFLDGNDWGRGYDVNPYTGQPYEPQIVPRGDYARVLAEFWADGPASETPPGHWFVILNYVSDHPLFQKRLGGSGPILDDLEWSVRSYILLAGTMHDVAVTSWGCKGWYDSIRPVSAIRYMADRGQSSDPSGPSYDPDGILLVPGYIEVVTSETTKHGERHEHLAGNEGKIALYCWRGPDAIDDPQIDMAGVGWILAENWWPYQRPSFVTPPFAGYVSGHSSYSRAAADTMTRLTGDRFFPGGLGEFRCPKNEFLVFEEGPSVDVTLQWATYQDASDQCSLSRIWGGIHPPCDDLPGRHMGEAVATDAWKEASTLFRGLCRADFDGDGSVTIFDVVTYRDAWVGRRLAADTNGDMRIDTRDFISFLSQWAQGCF